MAQAAADYLNGPDAAALEPAGLGNVLLSLSGISGSFAAARASIMARFAAAEAHDADGYGSPATWLTAIGKMARKDANALVREMRRLRDHPELHKALAAKLVSGSWAEQIATMTDRFPADVRDEIDGLLVSTAQAGTDLTDLAMVAQAAYEAWRQSQGPDLDDGSDGDPDDGGFAERSVRLGTTLDGVGRLNGKLTKECGEALQAVLDALGKRAGPEDDRTEAQRCHDALQWACELMLRAGMVPQRKGADTRVEAVVGLMQLRGMDGASTVEEAWLAGMADEHGYLTGKDAEVIACDALIVPVVTGHPDPGVVDEMIVLMAQYLGVDLDVRGLEASRQGGRYAGLAAGDCDADDPSGPDHARSGGTGSMPLTPQPWQALRYAIARLAIDLVSGPGGLASVLRQNLLDAPYNGKSVVLDIGFSETIPPSVRRAVELRAKGVCEWPGCRRRGSWCDVHHIIHKKDGGETSTWNCAMLCQFHHDICVHRNGWRFVLHPDASTSAYGPGGQELHSHGPPGGQGPPGDEAGTGDRGARASGR
jgi:hypothetical protein